MISDAAAPDSAGLPALGRRQTRRFEQLRTREYWIVVFWRLVILGAAIALWQYLPSIHWFSHREKWLNPFFISSPSRVYTEISRLATGSHNVPYVWPYLWRTVEATLLGTGIGLALGMTIGAFLANYDRLARILAIYVTVLNAMPRIALIPVIVIIVGTGVEAPIISSVLVVTFLAFFNAFEGGRSVPRTVLQNARVLKASPTQIMFRVRFPYVLMWVFAVVPNAIAFGLLTVVTTELLTGANGMGGLMLLATENVNSSLSFSVLIIMSILGVVLVTVAERIKRAVLHWAE